MGRLTRGSEPSRLARRGQVALSGAIWLLGASAVVTSVAPSPAWAMWTVAASGMPRASAQTVSTAAAPTAAVTGQEVTVSWTPTTLSGGTPVSGYVVRRYDASLVVQTVLPDCASVTNASCVEHGVPAGTWTYSVQAKRGGWVGAESARSSSVVVTAGVFSITSGQKVRAAANVTGGALSGFLANEAVTFRLDSASGTVLAASISSVGAGGAATGFTVTIPAGSGEGTHTIVAVGGSGSRAASNNFLFDSVAPSNSVSMTSGVNAFLNGGTLYFNSAVPGSFTLVDAVGDAGSGPASATFPTFTANRWTATGGSVSTPAGGPYTSPTYSWTAGPATPATQTVTGADAAGNTAASSVSFVADTTGPVIVAADVKLAPVGNTTTPGFIGQGRQYYIYAKATDAGSGIASMTADARNVTTGVTAAPMVAGTYVVAGVTYGWRTGVLTADNPHGSGGSSIKATATDNVGNVRTSPNSAVTVENIAPTGSITVPVAGASVPASATVTSNSADVGAAGLHSVQFQYSPAGAGSWATIATDVASPFTTPWSTAGLVDGGSYDLRAITTDNAGNTFTSPTVAVTVDRTAPAAPSVPVLAIASDSGALGDGVTSDGTPTYTGTAEPGLTVKLYDGVTQVGSATAAGGNWSITASLLGAGARTVTATATDAAGNVSAASGGVGLTVDTTAPTIVAADVKVAPVGNLTTAGWVTQGGQFHVYAKATDGGTGVTTVTADAGSLAAGQTAVPLVAGTYVVGGITYGWRSAALTAGSALAPGPVTVTATATDVAGNATASPGSVVTVDNTHPTGSITAPSNGLASALATVTSSSADGSAGVLSAEFQYSPAGAGTWTSIGADALAPFTVVWDTSALTEGGSYDLRVITTDNASNSFTSPSVAVVVDRTAPTAPSTPVLSPASDGGPDGDDLTNDDTPTYTGTAETGSTVWLFAGASPVGSATASGGSWSITASTLPSGTHTITATATDGAGNASPASPSVPLTVDTSIPTVTSVALSNGNVAGKMDAGDLGVVTFSEQMDASTFCSAWTNAGVQSLTDVTITVADSVGNDSISFSTPSCAFGAGVWRIGDYVGGGGAASATFTGSTLTWDPTARTLTVVVGTLATSNTIKTGVAPRANTYTGNAARTDLAGNALSTALFTNPTATGF